MTKIRTRFAPSPTGFLHVGGVRTALFAFLVAKQAGGDFILRIEDTDQDREVEGAAQAIYNNLSRLELTPDEGPHRISNNNYGPYIQSERVKLDIYQTWAQKLIDTGRAYADPYTAEEVQTFRETAHKNKQAFLYRNHRPSNPPTWDGSQPLRFKSDPKSYQWHDEVYGDLKSGPEVIDDFILIKSDGFPTYNFAHIVDDAEMKISHVIRGQEFLSSMPNYLNLYDALKIDWPIFATMPHIMNEQGNKKLSKRDGAKDVLAYSGGGYLKAALLSFIATLGWNDGTEQEIFTREELIEKFSLDRVQKSGARFDEKRLLWMNGQIIRGLPIKNLNGVPENGTIDESNLESAVHRFWNESEAFKSHITRDYRLKVLALAQDRLKTLQDIKTITSFFFEEPAPNLNLISGSKQLKRLSSMTLVSLLSATLGKLESLEHWNAETIQAALNELLVELDTKPGVLFSLIRTVTTWAPFSPELDKTLELLGKETTCRRLVDATKLL